MADKEDIITQTLDKDVVGMQNTFAELMLDKIRDAVAERKAQVAQEFMGVNPDDEEEYEDDEEFVDDEESEDEELEDTETDEDIEELMDDEIDFEEEDLEGDSDENA
jgi:hypothetical protein